MAATFASLDCVVIASTSTLSGAMGAHMWGQEGRSPPWLRRISAANATDVSEVVLEIQFQELY